MIAVLVADPRRQIIFARDCYATMTAATRALKLVHVVHAECRVLHRDLFVFFDVALSHDVQADEPRVRVAAVIDGAPLERVVAPNSPHFVRVRIGVRTEPRLLLRVPVLITVNTTSVSN